MILYYAPPAGDSIALPIVQAMHIVHGGKSIPELEKPENRQLLSRACTDLVCLQRGGFERPTNFLWGDDVKRYVRHTGASLRIVVHINGVNLWISEKTTLEQALKRFARKYERTQLTEYYHMSSQKQEEKYRFVQKRIAPLLEEATGRMKITQHNRRLPSQDHQRD